MKKWLAGILIALVALFFLIVYLFIPGDLQITAAKGARINAKALSRAIAKAENWRAHWPGAQPYDFRGTRLLFDSPVFEGTTFRLVTGTDTLRGLITVLPFGTDSAVIKWSVEMAGSSQPFKRIARYQKAKALEADLGTLATGMADYYRDEKNLYGFRVRQTLVTDSVLIYTSQVFDHYPSSPDIGKMVGQLRKYIAEQDAHAGDYPMLNVTTDGSSFLARVAIAVDRMLPETDRFAPKLVLKGGNILETEIQGGPETIRQAWDNFEQYTTDHERKSPAIPYQLMITDRTAEADTSRWITRLYYPVL